MEIAFRKINALTKKQVAAPTRNILTALSLVMTAKIGEIAYIHVNTDATVEEDFTEMQ